MKSGSNLEKVIASGKPAVTAELGPPMSADPHEVIKKAGILKGFCDAANITDCQTAVVRISSIAAAYIAQQQGLEPVMQMTCRDRNRIAMQADLLGAAALGLKNCLCIAGDHQKFSAAGRLKGHPGAKNVYDVDTCQLVGIMKKMRDEGLQQGGDKLEVAPKFFIGASWTPMGDPMDFRPYNLKKKVDAGADFIQTQGIYDMETFKSQMEKARNLGLHERTAILAGIIVPKSAMMLKYMDASVAGVTVPKPLIDRMMKAKEAAGDDKKKMKELQEQEGIKITIELVQQALEIPGVKGVHIQAIEWETAMEPIVKAAGLYPRPTFND
ncbi:MAG: methylenetetrahydrofolate reductase [Nitrospirae bacterium]|nr:methylenetetrahydrofolate reductase [Nitrospirota bacterium]